MAEYYTSVFSDSHISTILHYDEPNPYNPEIKAGDVQMVEFTILGNVQFATLNGGPYFQHSGAVSFMVPCASQDELDYYYSHLSSKEESEQCGWVEDKFGISWQLIPTNFTEYMKSWETEKKAKLMKAILDMKRLSWEWVENAYNS
jgi:predicted 3-demethylubiquinone-9 3-methyltransferase (glyoxalase superfamily)